MADCLCAAALGSDVMSVLERWRPRRDDPKSATLATLFLDLCRHEATRSVAMSCLVMGRVFIYSPG
jgi:hypothetical protein